MQKAQIDTKEKEIDDLKKFLVQREQDQHFIEDELENERAQLEQEYQELFGKMEFIRSNELAIK